MRTPRDVVRVMTTRHENACPLNGDAWRQDIYPFLHRGAKSTELGAIVFIPHVIYKELSRLMVAV